MLKYGRLGDLETVGIGLQFCECKGRIDEIRLVGEMVHHKLPLLLLSKLFTIVDEALVVSEAAIDGS